MLFFSLPKAEFGEQAIYDVKINGIDTKVLVGKDSVCIDPDGRHDVRNILDVNVSDVLVNFICD